MSSSAGGMLAPEEENEAEVRREDQEAINKFGRLNARLNDCRQESAALKVSLRLIYFDIVSCNGYSCMNACSAILFVSLYRKRWNNMTMHQLNS